MNYGAQQRHVVIVIRNPKVHDEMPNIASSEKSLQKKSRKEGNNSTFFKCKSKSIVILPHSRALVLDFDQPLFAKRDRYLCDSI